MGKKKSSVVELEKSLKNTAKKSKKAEAKSKKEIVAYTAGTTTNASDNAEDRAQKFCNLASTDSTNFTPAGAITKLLPPGLYEINASEHMGIYFTRLNVSTEDILHLPDSRTEEILSDVQKFWAREDIFAKYSLCHKRGILMYGAPGTSKTSSIRLIVADVVSRGGIALNFNNADLFDKGLRILRDVQATPVVIIFEDMEKIIQEQEEAKILQLLDGAGRINKILFLATTNYPEQLGERLTNRPSRFDKRYKFDLPTAAARRMYLEHLLMKDDQNKYDLDKWVEDTDNMSLAHVKESFVSIVILGNTYEDTIETLKAMSENISSGSEDGTSVGFSTDN